MKIKLVRTYDFNGEWYSLEVDNSHVSNSLTQDIHKAEKYYELLVKAKGNFKTKEILKESEV
jgi:hypothetical protein